MSTIYKIVIYVYVFIIVISLDSERDGPKNCELYTFYAFLWVSLTVIFSLKHSFHIIVYPHDGPPIKRIKVFKLSTEHPVALLHRAHHIEHSKIVRETDCTN